MFKKLLNLNFANKIAIFKGLQDIKDEIMTSSNVKLYCIPIGQKQFSIFFKGYGETQISKNMIKVLDAEDVDREIYFDMYLKTFCQSIVLEHA